MVSNTVLTAEVLAARLGGTLEGDRTRRVTTVAALDKATPDSLSWIGARGYVAAAQDSRAGVILVAADCPPLPRHTTICVLDPDVALLQVLRWLSPPLDGFAPGVDATACVHPDAVVTGARIGAHVSVGAGAVVGPGTTLHAGVQIGAAVQIGRDCVLWPNVVVRERVTIGERVIVHPNTTIGADGFGYLQRNGEHLKIPQIGTVVIEDDVEIGANCAIDRARMGVTRIGRGTKIDNLVQVAHNVEIGRGCIIVAQCGVAGSSKIGDHVMLGGQTGISDHVSIGDRAGVAAKSAVFRDVATGETVRGIPATANSRFLRNEASLRRLPTLVREFKALQKHVAELEARLSFEMAPTSAPPAVPACSDEPQHGSCSGYAGRRDPQQAESQ